MPSINPLLYDDNSEAESLDPQQMRVVQPPRMGTVEQTFEAFGTAAGNKTVAVWNNIKETAVAQVRSSMPWLPAEEAEPEWLKPTPIRELDPQITSKAAQTVGTIGADVLTMGLGIPFAAYMASSETAQETHQQLTKQGVDESTATAVATEKGIETAAGWALNAVPGAKLLGKFIPNKWALLGAKAVVGGTTVTAMDAAGGETRAQILEQHGFQKQADQMRHWDSWRAVGDFVGGSMLALGGEVRRSPEIPDDLVTASQHIGEVDHLVNESAPGIPATPAASAATSEATLKAINDIENGRTVSVDDVPNIADAEFIGPAPRELTEARKSVQLYESALTELRANRDEAAGFIERARRDGYHEEADHFAENVLPGRNEIVNQYETLLDHAKDELHALENPNALHRATEEIRPQLEEHAQAKAEMFDTADAYRGKTEEAQSVPKAPPPDVLTEAREMLATARNPVQEAVEGGAKPPKLTPAQQELVDHHYALRQLADETGDADLHAELDEAMNAHQREHMEAGQYNVAALCAIGV